jgi:hypothetical protein
MGRELLLAAEGLLRDAERQAEELERLLARVALSVSRTRPAPPTAPAATTGPSLPGRSADDVATDTAA